MIGGSCKGKERNRGWRKQKGVVGIETTTQGRTRAT